MTSPSGSPLVKLPSSATSPPSFNIQQSIPLSAALPKIPGAAGSGELPTSSPSIPRKGSDVKIDSRIGEIEKNTAEERKKLLADLEKERKSCLEQMQTVIQLKQNEQAHLDKIKELEELIVVQREINLKIDAELRRVQQEQEEAKAKNASQNSKMSQQVEANVKLLDEKEKSLQEIIKKNAFLEQAVTDATLECYNTCQSLEKQKAKCAELEYKVRIAEETLGTSQELKEANERYEKLFRQYEAKNETEKDKDALIAELRARIAASAQPVIVEPSAKPEVSMDALKQRVQVMPSSPGDMTPIFPTAIAATPSTPSSEPSSASRSPYMATSPTSSVQSNISETSATTATMAPQEGKDATIEKQEQMISTLKKTLFVVLGILVLIAIGVAVCFLFPNILSVGASALTQTWQFLISIGSRAPQVIPDFSYYAFRGIGI